MALGVAQVKWVMVCPPAIGHTAQGHALAATAVRPKRSLGSHRWARVRPLCPGFCRGPLMDVAQCSVVFEREAHRVKHGHVVADWRLAAWLPARATAR